jgi:hypothetical protein
MLATLALSLALALPQPEPTPAPETDALAGPTVAPDAPASLVVRDFDGKLRRLEIPAEEAALELLKLPPEEQAKADAVIAARRAQLDAIVGQNLELLLKFKTAKEAGSAQEVQQYLRQMLAKLGPVRDKGRLVDQLGAVLSPEKATELRRLSAEYWKAVIDDETGDSGERAKVTGRVMLGAIGLEIKRAYETRVGGQLAEVDDLIARLGLTAEQESKVRAVVLEYGQQTLGKPTDSQRAKLFTDLNTILTKEQRGVFLREIYATKGEREGAASK